MSNYAFDELAKMFTKGICTHQCSKACKLHQFRPGQLIPPTTILATLLQASPSEVSKACLRLAIVGILDTPQEVCKAPFYVERVPSTIRSAIQVDHIMLQLIAAGRLTQGRPLPSPVSIVESFDCSPTVLRTRMVARLVDHGILEFDSKYHQWSVKPRSDVDAIAVRALERFSAPIPNWATEAYTKVQHARPGQRITRSSPPAYWLLSQFGLAEEVWGAPGVHGKIVCVPRVSQKEISRRLAALKKWPHRHVVDPDKEGWRQFMSLLD